MEAVPNWTKKPKYKVIKVKATGPNVTKLVILDRRT